jgi:hypothetical protein
MGGDFLMATRMMAGLWLLTEVGPLRGCRAVAPRELPSGAAPGAGAEGVSRGAKQVVWGSGPDRVEQTVGIAYDDGPGTRVLDAFEIHGSPAVLYRFSDPDLNPGVDLAIGWEEGGCSLTVFLPPGMTEEQARDFAARY